MATIVDFNALAAAQVGVPYLFGGTALKGTPSPGLDCSGLIYAVSLALGVTIPRTSEAQFSGLPAVSGALRQGDLVFYDVPADDQPQPAHVAIWWDANTVLQAPRTGEDVQFSPPLPYTIMGYRRLPFPSAPPPPSTEEIADMPASDPVITPNGDIVTYVITPQNHYVEVTRSANAQGEAATNGSLSIIDITAAYPQFTVSS